MSNKPTCSFDLFAEEFPDDVDVSTLCDCGRHVRMGRPKYIRNQEVFPETDYMSTFKAVQHPRPRSSKRPPPSPRDPNPPRMTFDTNQRNEYKTPRNQERTKPIIREEQYEPPNVPLDGETSYQKEYTVKELVPDVHRVSPRQDRLKASTAKFDGITTTQEHFRKWVPQPSMTFGELPSFTGSVLFPNKEALPTSVMRSSYPGAYQKPIQACKGKETNIKLEGDMNFGTTHNETFKMVVGDHRVQPINHKPDIPLQKQGKFAGQTQTGYDFGYRGRQPPPPKPAEPAPATIDLRFDNRTSFDTEQRSTFKGHDVVMFPAPHSCKQSDDYKPPNSKFTSETSQRHDFQPIEISEASQTKARIPPTQLHTSPDIKFATMTTNKDFFQNWEAKPRVRYGDFHENRSYVAPQSKFEGASVTQSAFTTKRLEHTKSYKPEETAPKPNGITDYGTSYSDTYTKKEVPMCRAQLYLMQQELKRRRKVAQNPEMSNSLIFAK